MYIKGVSVGRGLIPELTEAKEELIKSDFKALLFDMLVEQYPVVNEECFEAFFFGDSLVEQQRLLVMGKLFRGHVEFCSIRITDICEVVKKFATHITYFYLIHPQPCRMC